MIDTIIRQNNNQTNSSLERKRQALALARASKAERKAAGVVISRSDPIAKSKLKPTSLRLAINAKCWECSGSGADPGTRESIATCNIPTCPLNQVRPYQHGDNPGEE